MTRSDPFADTVPAGPFHRGLTVRRQPVRPELEGPDLIVVDVDHVETLCLAPENARGLARALTDAAEAATQHPERASLE